MNDTTADDFTDAEQTLSVAESATIDDEEILNHYRQSHITGVNSDNNDEESSEELGPPKRSSRSLQNCSLFEEEQVAFHLQV